TRGPSRRLVPSLDQDVVTGPAVEGVLPQPADQDTEAPNASPVTRMDSLPLVPLTMTASAWNSAAPVRNMEFLSPHHGLTCSVSDCSLASKVASPLWTARMTNRPATEKEPRMRAWPLASSVTRATTVLPTKNVTVPVGVPVPDGSRTVAVNVTACPTLAG